MSFSEEQQEKWIKEQIEAAAERIRWAQVTHRERYDRENRFLMRALLELSMCQEFMEK